MIRPRVSLLRGAYLGCFEAQNFEPLLDRFDVRAYVLPQNPFDLAGCRLPVTVCRFPDSRLFRGRSLVNAWRSRIRKERYPMPGVPEIVRRSDLVHTFEAWYAYTRQAARACRLSGVPLVITHWDTIPYSRSVDARNRREIDDTLNAASRILAATGAARQALLAEGVPEEKIVLQGMGVDTNRFCPGPRPPELARQLGIREEDVVFLFLGRLAADKGIRELVAAFRELCLEPGAANARLLLVGKGSEQPWVLEQASVHGLRERILVAPPAPYGQVHLWHRLGDIFVFPSIPSPAVEEQFGYALVEAMACGLAAIASREGGIPDVTGDAALLVEPGDVQGLCRAMRQLMHFPEARRRMGLSARDRIERNYSARQVAAGLSLLYDHLLQARSGDRKS